MFEKMQDALVVLVLVYIVYKIGWVNGWTMINIFILVCSVMAVIAMILRRSGFFQRADAKKREYIEKEKEEK